MLFQFNLYSSLLLPCFIQGILYTILFFIRSKREDNRADLFLAFLTLWSTSHITAWMLGFAGWYDVRDGYSQFMFYFPFSNWFFLGPLIYFFVKAKTKSNFRLKGKDYWHFLIPGLAMLWVFICFFIDVIWKQTIMGETLVGHNGTRGDFAQVPYGILSIPLQILMYALLFYYIFKSLKHYRKYRDYIVSELSIADQVDIRWVRNILYALSTAIILWFLSDLSKLFIEMTFVRGWWGYFFWGLVIFYISISGYQDESHINNQLDFDPIKTGNSKKLVIAAPTQLDKNLVDKQPILDIMESEAPYLKPNLSLNDLAKNLKIAPNQLSKNLNSAFNQNFNEFINEYRIKAVTQKLNDPDFSHYSILGIALECGFNSKATFNRVFKLYQGMSPSEYRKKFSE